MEKKSSKFMQPLKLSPELAAVVGEGPMARTEVTKKLWAYIKKHKRQLPNDKRKISPDDKLAKIFGSSKPMDMFQMIKHVNKHILPPSPKKG